MTDVLIPFGAEVLMLTREQFEAAREAGALVLGRSREISAPMPSARESDLVNAMTLARELSLPRSTIYELAKAERIPCVRVGRHVRFDRAAVRAALNRS